MSNFHVTIYLSHGTSNLTCDMSKEQLEKLLAKWEGKRVKEKIFQLQPPDPMGKGIVFLLNDVWLIEYKGIPDGI